MDLRTIKTFKTIVEFKSFQRAADHLNYAQSTVTTQIKKLEAYLGVTLFERGNHLQLTKAGILLNEQSNIVLQSFDRLEATMTGFIEGDAELIRIGIMEPTASYRMPNLLTKFSKQYANVQISLQVHGSKVLSDMVVQDEIDFAICATPATYGDSFFESIYKEDVVLLTPVHHPINDKEKIYLSDLQHERLVITNEQCPFRATFEHEMITKGWLPVYGMEVSNMLTLKYYVQSGFGAAIVPAITVQTPPQGTVVKQIEDFKAGLTVGILSKTTHKQSRALETIIELLKTIPAVNKSRRS